MYIIWRLFFSAMNGIKTEYSSTSKKKIMTMSGGSELKLPEDMVSMCELSDN